MSNPITVDITQAADMLKVHRQTVRELIFAGELPAAKIGRQYVMLTRDVVALIERRIAEDSKARMMQ